MMHPGPPARLVGRSVPQPSSRLPGLLAFLGGGGKRESIQEWPCLSQWPVLKTLTTSHNPRPNVKRTSSMSFQVGELGSCGLKRSLEVQA